jgi:hypothetical protein
MTKKAAASPQKKAVVKANKTKSKPTSKLLKSSPQKGIGTGVVKDKIFQYVCKQHTLEATPVDKEEIALSAGFKNPRSAGFADPLKELIASGLLCKGNGNNIDITEKGIANMPKDLDVSQMKIEDLHNSYKECIISKLGGKNADKVHKLWELLMDRKAHSIEDVAKELGYGNPRSFGNTKIIPAMKEKKFVVEVDKSLIKFSEKVRF